MKTRLRLFWSYDIVKTQNWLDKLSEKGYQLKSINSFLRLFRFEKGEPKDRTHIISFNKKLSGYPKNIESNSDYERICFNKNYFVVSKRVSNPEILPSYDGLFSKNTKLKMVSGQILLVELILSITPLILILSSLFSGNIEVTEAVVVEEATIIDIIQGIIFYSVIFGQIWLLYTHFKLQKTNKELALLCGDTKEISFTIPTDTILSKDQIKKLKTEDRLIKKTRIAWFYSPDKHERWLESMEADGYHLQRMSKIGNSFYFIKGEPRKVKFHVDHQKRKGATYYSINEENGWRLYFTSVPRYFAISVWGKEYTNIEPEYYSDEENRIKHARLFMLMYAVPYSLVVVLHVAVFIQFLTLQLNRPELALNPVFLFPMFMMLLLITEFSYFTIRIVNYYFRVKRAEHKRKSL